MFGIGATEMVIIGVVLLVAVGPTRLPKLLKAVVTGYREFRRAARELRASTGIDEILQDESLKELRKPIDLGLNEKPLVGVKRTVRKKRALSFTERVQECPPEGVDLAVIREIETRPSEAEREAIRARKEAKLAEEEAVRQAKIAAEEARQRAEAEAARQRAGAEAAPEGEPEEEGGEPPAEAAPAETAERGEP